MKEYAIAQAWDWHIGLARSEAMSVVARMLGEGWQIEGGISCMTIAGERGTLPKIVYAQAMTRDIEPPA